MQNYFIQYKPFLIFLGKFFLTYALLTFAYESYLNQFDSRKLEVDGFTKSVAKQTVGCLNFFNQDASQASNPIAVSIKLIYNKKYIAQIIEGCNGLSVIILFIAFIIAFTGKLKPTLLYIVFGGVIIHVLNIVRIAVLCAMLYHYPQFKDILHDIIFPLFIYGIVFLLWIIWINKFSLHASKTI